MKKIILLLLTAMVGYSQPVVNIWRTTPDSVCPGDSMKIDYKAVWPVSPDNTNNFFFITPSNTVMWFGNWSILKARPKEHYSALSFHDSTYWIKVKVPVTVPIGTQTVFNNGPSTGTVYVKNCNCTITALFAWTSHFSGAVTFTSTSVGTNSTTVYLWDFGIGPVIGGPTMSYTFTSGQYPVTLHVVNPTCDSKITIWVNADETPDGIKEYEQDKLKPVYYDIYGNIIEPRLRILMIESVGNRRRKVFISE